MGGEYSLSPDEMRNVATTMDNSSTELQNTMNSLSNAASTLADSWRGAGSDEFQTDFAEFKTAYDKMQECLTERANALRSSAQLADDTQQTLIQQWQ